MPGTERNPHPQRDPSMSTLTAPPVAWYRQLWPWLLMLMPALALFGGIATWWLAAVTSDPLVVDDYYREGRAINRRLERDAAAARLGLSAVIARGADGSVVVDLDAAPGAELDRRVELTAIGAGRYVAAAERLPESGRWHLVLEEPQRRWRLTGVATGFAQPQRLGAQP
jgi:hypothetical protein